MTPSITVALAIPHTPWVPERVASRARLLGELGLNDHLAPVTDAAARAVVASKQFDEKCPNHVWSGDLWSWANGTGATHLVQLQDDVRVAPNFWAALLAMLQAHPDELVGLETAHPGAMTVARGGTHGCTTSDGLVGPGYAIPLSLATGSVARMADVLSWRANGLKRGALETITEDSLLCLFAYVHGAPVWHPAPTIIDHDVDIPSTYGNDDHGRRRPTVTWRDGDVCGFELADLERPDFWAGAPVHLGRFYTSTERNAVTWCRDFSPGHAVEAQRRDAGVPARLTRFAT